MPIPLHSAACNSVRSSNSKNRARETTTQPIIHYALRDFAGKATDLGALDDGSTDQSFSIEPVSVTLSGASHYVLLWLNPHPDLPIVRIEFRVDSPLASPILFAVTGIR